MRQRRYNQALPLCENYHQQYPDNIQVLFIKTDIYLHLNSPDLALASINKAETLDPLQPQIKIKKIQCLLLCGISKDALQTANQLFNKNPNLLAKDWLNLGFHFHQLNELPNSHHCFKRASELEPNNSHHHFNFATSLRNQGEFEKAIVEFEKVIELKPDDWEAYLARSQLGEATIDNNHIKELESAIEKNTQNDQAQIKLNFALAKEREDCADYNNSFTCLRKANQVRNKLTDYNVKAETKAFEEIITTYNNNKVSSVKANNSSAEPIFILGLPRTGTTLLERIISQHKDVFAAGELPNFSTNLILETNRNAISPINNKLELIKQSASIDFNHLGKSYIESTRPLTGHTLRFIDKMPLNFLYTGLIQKALPNAKIIHLTRSPMAACYAIYKTNFGQAYPFSYDLENIASYYIAYRQLMAHWLRNNSNNLIEVNYESLVSDSEKTCQQVFDFCELQWNSDYLQLANNTAASATASSGQIRGEIYQSSKDRWRHFELQLAPLKERLIDAGLEPDRW